MRGFVCTWCPVIDWHPIRVCNPPCALGSWNMPWIQHNSSQDKVTEDNRIGKNLANMFKNL